MDSAAASRLIRDAKARLCGRGNTDCCARPCRLGMGEPVTPVQPNAIRPSTVAVAAKFDRRPRLGTRLCPDPGPHRHGPLERMVAFSRGETLAGRPTTYLDIAVQISYVC